MNLIQMIYLELSMILTHFTLIIGTDFNQQFCNQMLYIEVLNSYIIIVIY
jgi:hypothetical protein